MKIARTAATVTLTAGLMLALGACSSDDSDDTTSSSEDTSTTQTDDDANDDDAGSDDPASTDIASSCEEFNTLMDDIRATDAGDSDAFDAIYLRSEDAEEVAPAETEDLFDAVSLLALDKSLGDESQETADALRDATFAASGACTAEGVTLTL
ncbi:hypothetical protein [Sanguibacter sp. 25GB23B1]|uniref:hypothetical protein n=1 Tax=unclassified Sanguibacter TaxID=2645534 RepID=UPI0032AE87BF